MAGPSRWETKQRRDAHEARTPRKPGRPRLARLGAAWRRPPACAARAPAPGPRRRARAAGRGRPAATQCARERHRVAGGVSTPVRPLSTTPASRPIRARKRRGTKQGGLQKRPCEGFVHGRPREQVGARRKAGPSPAGSTSPWRRDRSPNPAKAASTSGRAGPSPRHVQRPRTLPKRRERIGEYAERGQLGRPPASSRPPAGGAARRASRRALQPRPGGRVQKRRKIDEPLRRRPGRPSIGRVPRVMISTASARRVQRRLGQRMPDRPRAAGPAWWARRDLHTT